MLPCRTDLPWWAALVAVVLVFGAVTARRVRRGEPLGSTSWGTNVSRLVSLYLVFGLPQLSHTLLTTSDPCHITDRVETLKLVSILLATPALAVVTELVPILIPEGSAIPRTEGGLPTGRGWGILLARVFVVVVGAHLVQGALWVGSSWVPGLTLHGLGLAEVALLVIFVRVVGRLVDAIVTSQGARIVGVLIALPGVLFAYGPLSPADTVEFARVDERDWYDAALDRLDAIPDDGPVILVAASGGGSRAALFAALVFETLSADPATLVVREGADHPVLVNWRRPLSEYVFAVSSVSGGSVASAAYVAGRSSSTAPTRTFRAGGKQWPSILANVGPQVGNAAWHSELQASELLDVAMTDFNTVAVHGFLAPNLTRGEALEQFWESQYGWTERIAKAPSGKAPLLLINATLAESGRPLVLGYPPLPESLLAENHLGAARLPPVAAERIGRVPLARLSGADSLPVSMAVRLSASFPFGMDAAVLEVEGQRYRETVVREVHITDGGVVDNTGTGTLRGLLTGLETEADEEPRARELVHRLKARGVLVVEIDSGAKPLLSLGLAKALFGPALEAASAVSMAGYTNERDAVELRRRLLRKSGYKLSWATFSYCPRQDGDEVMTAWGLGAPDMQRLASQFFTQTLTGACAERPVPRPLEDASDVGLSPLHSIASAFQSNEAPIGEPLPGELRVLRLTAQNYTVEAYAEPTPEEQRRDRFIHSEVDAALLGGDASAAMAAARLSDDKMIANAAGTLGGVVRTLATGDDGRVYTIDEDDARAGWFAAARFEGPELRWCRVAAACADRLVSVVGQSVLLGGPALIHGAENLGPFAPGYVVALAQPYAHLHVVDRLEESIGDQTTVYLAVTWKDSVSEIAPCTALERELVTCPAHQEYAATLRERILAQSSMRGACFALRVEDPPEAPGVWVDRLRGLEGDADALAEWSRAALGIPIETRDVTAQGRDQLIGLHFCPEPDPAPAPPG